MTFFVGLCYCCGRDQELSWISIPAPWAGFMLVRQVCFLFSFYKFANWRQPDYVRIRKPYEEYLKLHNIKLWFMLSKRLLTMHLVFKFCLSVCSLQFHHASQPTRRPLPQSHRGPPHPNHSYPSRPRAAPNPPRMPTWMGARAPGRASAPSRACPTPQRASTAWKPLQQP